MVLLLIIGLLSALGNFLLYQAAAIAPNAGLALAIGGLQSCIVAILAFLVFKDNLAPLQIAGIILAVVAIFLFNIGSSSPQKAVATEAPENHSK